MQTPSTPLPPTKTLLDNLEGIPSRSTPTNERLILSDPVSRDTSDSRWVTVFGFPPGLAGAVLREMLECGSAAQYHVGNGNWMYIQYDSPLSVQRALGRNGKLILNDSMMIGVTASNEKAPVVATRARSHVYSTAAKNMQMKPKRPKPYDVDVPLAFSDAKSNRALLGRLNNFFFGA
eukprot:Rmarinus@m.21550